MQALASFIMRGRSRAALAAAGLSVLSLLIPPLLLLANAAVALVTLRRGGAEGGQVMAIALGGGALLGWLVLGSPAPMVILPLFWLPVWLLALVLRRSVSLAVTLQAAVALGLVGVVLGYLLLGDPALWWGQFMEQFRQAMLTQASAPEREAVEQWFQVLSSWGPVVPGLMTASVLIWVVLSLLLGRWWQALLFNPGGFRQEFHELRLPQGLALVTLALLVVNWFTGSPLSANLLLVLVPVHALQGIAVVHALVNRLALSAAWLVAFYVLVLFAWWLVMLLGLVDVWADFRARAKPRRPV